jgi:hypothetical protein
MMTLHPLCIICLDLYDCTPGLCTLCKFGCFVDI